MLESARAGFFTNIFRVIGGENTTKGITWVHKNDKSLD